MIFLLIWLCWNLRTEPIVYNVDLKRGPNFMVVKTGSISMIAWRTGRQETKVHFVPPLEVRKGSVVRFGKRGKKS